MVLRAYGNQTHTYKLQNTQFTQQIAFSYVNKINENLLYEKTHEHNLPSSIYNHLIQDYKKIEEK